LLQANTIFAFLKGKTSKVFILKVISSLHAVIVKKIILNKDSPSLKVGFSHSISYILHILETLTHVIAFYKLSFAMNQRLSAQKTTSFL